MTSKNNLLKNSIYKEILITIFFGSLAFFFIFGFEIFNSFPNAFNQGDYLAYQTSYFAYLNSKLTFPIFYSNMFFENQFINLYLADFIPLYLLFLKFLNSAFNVYLINPFTIWIYLNTLLIFYFSYKIFLLTSKLKAYQNILGAFLIAILPLSPMKILNHLGEGSHWVIVCGIYLYFKVENKNKYIYLFSIFSGLMLWIHFYLFTFVSALWACAVLSKKLNLYQLIFSCLIFITIFTSIFLLTFGSIENFIFSVDNGIKSTFNPNWSAESNSFFCSENKDLFLYELLKCYEPYTNKDLESYSFLGLGIILFSFFILYEFKEYNHLLIKHKFLIFTSVLFLIFSFGNRVKIFHKQIFEFQFSDLHLFLINIYRAHSRFAYIFYYLFCLFFLYRFFLLSNKKLTFTLMLFIFSFIQINSLDTEYSSDLFLEFTLDTPEAQVFEAVKSSLKFVDKRLYIYPPDNCVENYDLYLFAKEFMKNGGKIHASRIRGGQNFVNCKNIYDLNENLINFDPYHFITSETTGKIQFEFIKLYKCKSISGFYEENNYNYCYRLNY